MFTRVFELPTHGSHAHPLWSRAETASTMHKHDRDYLDRHGNHHIHKDVDQIGSKLKKRPLSKAGIAALKYYSSHEDGAGSYTMNRALIHGEYNDDEDTVDDHIDALTSEIHNHRLSHDMKLYHGTSSFHPKRLVRKGKGKGGKTSEDGPFNIHLPGFTSTSHSLEVAHQFAQPGHSHSNDPNASKHVLRIHMQKGMHGLHALHHEDHTDAKLLNEKETVLQKGLRLKVHPNPHKMVDGTHVWDAYPHDYKEETKAEVDAHNDRTPAPARKGVGVKPAAKVKAVKAVPPAPTPPVKRKGQPTHEDYKWRKFEGSRKATLHFRGKPHTDLKAGDRYGLREHSDGTHRLITEKNGHTIVHKVSNKHAEGLKGRSTQVRKRFWE